MQRVVTIALGIAVVVLAVLLAFRSSPHVDAPAVVDAGVAEASVDAGALVAVDAADASADDETAGDTPPADTGDAGPLQLADGTPVPPLGPKAPKHVRFGVVLVSYEGAQGASEKARSRKDALTLATKLAEDAKTDFAGAVHNGDEGSATDIGVVDRNILEPTSEAVLFALPVGGTGGVIDTPRGFWIVKRLE